MDSAIENLIKYFMTICAAGAIVWKAIDAWEKRKTAPIKELTDDVKELKAEIKTLKEEDIRIKAAASEVTLMVAGYFKR